MICACEVPSWHVWLGCIYAWCLSMVSMHAMHCVYVWLGHVYPSEGPWQQASWHRCMLGCSTLPLVHSLLGSSRQPAMQVDNAALNEALDGDATVQQAPPRECLLCVPHGATMLQLGPPWHHLQVKMERHPI